MQNSLLACFSTSTWISTVVLKNYIATFSSKLMFTLIWKLSRFKKLPFDDSSLTGTAPLPSNHI